jgi:nitronate monooxygenase
VGLRPRRSSSPSPRPGALGFLAGGYRTADELEQENAQVRASTSGAFGVNVFVPRAPTGDPVGLERYLGELRADADALGVALGPPAWHDDAWAAKAELLVSAAPPAASFTFGCPAPALVRALRQRGTLVIVTVTTVAQAREAADAGADALRVQGTEAGAHRGSFTDAGGDVDGLGVLELVTAVPRRPPTRRSTRRPGRCEPPPPGPATPTG